MSVNTWTPGRVAEAIERGWWWVLPPDWREILAASGYAVPPVQEALPWDADTDPPAPA